MAFKQRVIAGITVSLGFWLWASSFQHSHPFSFRSGGPDTLYQQLSETQKRSPQFALAGLDLAGGVAARLFAHEPMVRNPTAIDIDHRGRVWVCEAGNYRPHITGRPANPQGDRIVILEDTDGDGQADKSTVFYQDPTLNAPIGIWVAGNKAIISQSPYVWLLTDENGDDVADKKEVIFSGIEGEQHDHGIHSFTFGPDGKFYCAVGNEGKQLKDKDGNPLRDKNGELIDFKKYRQGFVIRCDQDFSNIEVLGHNFRNNYEAAVDSYGNIWQSDNDDDGNRGVRINFVMEHGNYGYTDELTGAGWRANRTNIEDSIPFRHWHLNDPGVVPNLLQTGSGSPTGLVFYEGELLPPSFRNQMIHCDAGPNVVRAYPVQKSGAGFSASIANLVHGRLDQWFRPSDVCVAPDGSVFVADWYDPGVGGHQMGDSLRGRIYRLAPEASGYRVPSFDLRTGHSALKALDNPNASVRFLAWNALLEKGKDARTALEKRMTDRSAKPLLRARAFWAWSKIAPRNHALWNRMISDPNPDLRIVAIRAARQTGDNMEELLWKMAGDKDPQVRREVALSLYGKNTRRSAETWAKLASQHDGTDRWYLEALGIGAEGKWDAVFSAWMSQAGKNLPTGETAAEKDIIWRARTALSVPLLSHLAGDGSVPLAQRLRYFRAFDFNPGGPEKSEALLALMKGNTADQQEISTLVLRHIDPAYARTHTEAMSAVQKLMDETYGTEQYMELVNRFEPKGENKRLLALAIEKPYEGIGRNAGQQLLKQDGLPLVREVLQGNDEQKTAALMASISRVGNETTLGLLKGIAMDPVRPVPLRRHAVRALAGSMSGEDILLDHLKQGKIQGELKAAAIQSLNSAWRKAVRKEANSYIDSGAASDDAPKHPPVSELITKKGDAVKGKEQFMKYCSICHQVNGEGMDFGPKLSEIGDKLPKEGQYLALYYPSAGISFGYEGYEVKFRDGAVTAGIISSKTETDLILKFPGGSTQEYKMADVASIKPLDESMMSPGLQNAMNTEELVDLVEYLSNLRKK